MNDIFFVFTYYYAQCFLPYTILGNYWLFLAIIDYSTIGYSKLFYHTPLLAILFYFTIGYCWLFQAILP